MTDDHGFQMVNLHNPVKNLKVVNQNESLVTAIGFDKGENRPSRVSETVT